MEAFPGATGVCAVAVHALADIVPAARPNKVARAASYISRKAW
jgi:hypothetical protein